MNKITIIAVASLMSVSSFAFAEEAAKPAIAPASTIANAQKDMKNIKNNHLFKWQQSNSQFCETTSNKQKNRELY